MGKMDGQEDGQSCLMERFHRSIIIIIRVVIIIICIILVSLGSTEAISASDRRLLGRPTQGRSKAFDLRPAGNTLLNFHLLTSIMFCKKKRSCSEMYMKCTLVL